MLVYQALKRFTSSVKVTHALDDHLFQDEWEGYLDDKRNRTATGATQPSYASLATIGTSIRGPIALDGLGDGYPDPEELHYTDYSGGDYYGADYSCDHIDRTGDMAFTRDHVTWLNHHPQKTTPRELAVAFLVVSVMPKCMAGCDLQRR